MDDETHETSGDDGAGPPRSVALVLGGGGVIGAGFHAGALAAIADATGWDARTADLIVGTSAGAGIAATLRIGFSPTDHLRRACDEEMTDEGRALAEVVPRHRLRIPERPRLPLVPLPESPGLVVAALRPHRGGPRPGLLWAGLSPRGRIDSDPIGERIRHVLGDRWPDAPTWVCAVDLRSGRRVVFGRDERRWPDLGTAVQASSAVPGFFAPVRFDGHTYVDGGAWSATNLDLVAGLQFDVAVVLAPLSMGASRRDREERAVTRSGTRVIVVAPRAEDRAVLRGNPLANDKAGPVARHMYAAVRDRIEREGFW